MSLAPLLKVLTEAGIGSRRRIADAIRQGRVEVNGKVVEDFRCPVNVGKDRVSINGQLADLKTGKPVYLVLNKPKGVLSTASDEKRRRTVIDILPEKYRYLRLYPACRLDKNSTGLLLLTNDGGFTYQLTHPKFEHEKEYIVLLDKKLQPAGKRRLEHGIDLEDGTTYPAVVTEAKGLPPFSYGITIHEGKKRQVRRMFESLGYQVRALKRVRIGNIGLGDLKEGETRELSAKEAQALLGSEPVPGEKPSLSV